MTRPTGDGIRRQARRALVQSWWLLFPCFALLTVRLLVARTCGADPDNLLPGLMAQRQWAWPLAVVYLLAHLWMLAAYLLAVNEADALGPPLTLVGGPWGSRLWKVLLMGAVLLLEYSPVYLWRLLGSGIGCR